MNTTIQESIGTSKRDIVAFVALMALPFLLGFVSGWFALWLLVIQPSTTPPVSLGFLDFLSYAFANDFDKALGFSFGFTLVLGGLLWAFMYGKWLDEIMY